MKEKDIGSAITLTEWQYGGRPTSLLSILGKNITTKTEERQESVTTFNRNSHVVAVSNYNFHHSRNVSFHVKYS